MRVRFSLTASATAWAPWSWRRLAVRLGRGEQASEPQPALQPPSLLPGDPDRSPIPSPTPGLHLVRWDCWAQALRALECAPGRRACHASWGWAGGRLCLVGLPAWSPAGRWQSCLVTHSLQAPALSPHTPFLLNCCGGAGSGRATVTTRSILVYFAASEGDMCQGHHQASRPAPPPQPHPSPKGPPVSSQPGVGRAPGGIREP